MAVRLKTSLGLFTSFLLLLAVWTAQYQAKTVIFALALGISGTFLIFATEFGYTYRKKGVVKRWPIKSWLRVHIVIGIAGPLIIVLHTGLNFHGFAGWLTALTATVVGSGFVGRYIYRRIPRSIKGQALSQKKLEAACAEIQERLKTQRLLADMDPDNHQLRKDLKKLELELLTSARRTRLLTTSKKLLSRWRLLHVPLTTALIIGILVHVGGIFYYGKVLP